jgi:hydroxymethylpyrimidine pyrophosphatase-like HAD family hydrolase
MGFKIIAVDFDGTLCEDKWPEIGEPNKELIEYLKEEQRNRGQIILWTCRVGRYLDEAIEWCKQQGLTFNAINDNLPEVVSWNGGINPRKIFADEYIDDKMCGRFELPYITTPKEGAE